MIYVTGDLHGDISRFKSKPLRRLRRGDTLIVCGDFGFVWDGSPQEQRTLRWIGKRRYNVLFVDGIHDNLTLIEKYPTAQWMGGQVREISGNLRYLCRGQVFSIEDKTIFAFGGGEDEDIAEDAIPATWWDRQLPRPEEIQTAKQNLAAVDHTVDYIITHQCSRQTKQLLTMEDDEVNVLDTFFDTVRDTVNNKGWFFGNYHLDKILPPKEMAIFMKVIPLLSTFKESLQRGK